LGGRPLLLLLAVAGLCTLAAWLSWGGRGRRGPRPSVLVVTIDTLRADAATPEDMPALRELAAAGLFAPRARTPAPLTLPAHVTLFSGLLPPRHGVRDNTAPPLPPREERDYELLAEGFTGAGYDTAAFVAASVMDERYGLDAGFRTYRQPAATQPGKPSFRAFAAEEQVRRFANWYEARRADRPFFAWVHLWDPHAPYAPYDGDERRPVRTEPQDPAPARYRGEVRRADAALESLLALVDRGSTVVLVTSDHGEGLGEHGEKTHGHLVYGATMDVPLVLAGPGVGTGVVDRPVSLEDVAPTLRALAGLRPRGGDGRSLLGPEPAAARVLCGESLYANRLYGWAQQSVATDGRYTLVDGGPRFELFDRAADPDETAPLPDLREHAEFERLDRALRAYRRLGEGGRGGADVALAGSPYGSVRRNVRTFLKPAENRRRRDVATGFDDIALLARMDGLIAAHGPAPSAIDARQAVRRLLPAIEDLRRRDERNPAPCLAQGRALALVLDRPDAAVEALREAVRRGYDTPGVRKLIAVCERR